MNIANALGLWKSSFGAVKVEEDNQRGPNSGWVHGVWVYDRNGQEVIGYFSGMLRGNVLEFKWREPATPQPLTGDGFLVFDPGGARFSGRWWASAQQPQGEWNGWRQTAPPQQLQ